MDILWQQVGGHMAAEIKTGCIDMADFTDMLLPAATLQIKVEYPLRQAGGGYVGQMLDLQKTMDKAFWHTEERQAEPGHEDL